MKPLQQKLSRYTAPQEAKAKGVYPYFREISSDQDTEVLMNGRKILMLGSNSYLGLTNHPKIKEAAKAAIDKYGTGCAGSPFLNGTLDIHHQLEDILADFIFELNQQENYEKVVKQKKKLYNAPFVNDTTPQLNFME